MEKVTIGEKLKIKCYKHNGQFHREWDEAVVLDETPDYLICGNFKTKVTESDGHSYRTKEPAILYFYKHNWFNVIAQLKSFGLFYYCNIASPYIIEHKTIKYIDYDLDLRVFPNHNFKVLDRNEYKFHRKKMQYSQEICEILERELSLLIEKKKANEDAFEQSQIAKYIEKYKELVKKDKKRKKSS